MAHQAESTVVDTVVQLLCESGLSHMADAVRILLNEAMKIERSRAIEAEPYERSERRRGYANGYKPKTLDTRLGKYLTVVYQIDDECKRLLWVGKDRTVRTLLQFFREFGPERSTQLRYVCSDMWKAYLKVIAKKASQAIHVLDRFHIAQHMNKAIDEVRAQEARELRAKGVDVLKHSRWCLLKRPENLTNVQETKLTDLLRFNLKAVRSYLLKEDFQFFWQYIYPQAAGKFLDAWCRKAMRSRIEPMKKVARMLRSHRELLLNWFRAKKTISSGAIEGLNNKLKLTTRKSYGFRTFRAAEIMLYHTLGNLPEPECTHRFC